MFKETFHHSWYPFQNQAEIDRVRKITFEDIVAMNGKHPTNPNIQLDVLPVDNFETVMITDMVKRIIDSDRNDTPCIMIMCNPNPTYIKVAYMLQQLKVNMRNVKFYMMDEWADEDGNIAPLTYKAGFGTVIVNELTGGVLPGYMYTPESLVTGGYETDTSMLDEEFGINLMNAALAAARSLR